MENLPSSVSAESDVSALPWFEADAIAPNASPVAKKPLGPEWMGAGRAIPADKTAARDEFLATARRSRDAFRDACAAASPDDAEANFAECRAKLVDLWRFARLRDQPFRDLLGLVEAAVRSHEFDQLHQAQRDALAAALADLAQWFLDDAAVEKHIASFVEHDINTLKPVLLSSEKRYRVVIEEDG